MAKFQNDHKILANEKVTPRFYKLSLDKGALYKKALPGQFVNIKVADGTVPLLRRPFGIHRNQKDLEIFYEAVGEGTRLLSEKKKGESLDILGPLGNSFSLPSKRVKQIVMIAGGVGIAPFLFLADRLKKNSKAELILLYGGRSKEHVFSMKEFKKGGCKVFVATEDGSMGIKGRVDKLYSKITHDGGNAFIYACGPKPMLASVVAFARDRAIKGELSAEETMGCGTGACLGCVVKTTKGYKTVCHDGPVFDLDELVF